MVRGFKNMDTARLLTHAWLVHYNFFKEHTTLGDVPPTAKMGATPIKDWGEVVSQTKTITPLKPTGILATMTKPIPKKRHPKRRPKELRQKDYTEVAVYTDRKKERLSRRPHRGWKRIY